MKILKRPSNLKICFLLLSMSLFSVLGEARVFDLKKEYFASFFSVSMGTANLAKGTYDGETTQKTFSYDQSWGNNQTGEFGFVYAMSNLGLRFSLEVFRPADLKTVSATNTAGTETYTLGSTLTGYAPKVTGEFYFVNTSTTRGFFTVYGSTVSVNYRNEYTSVNYGAIGAHSYEAKGSGNLLGGAFGVETFFNDTTTMVLETGYRSLVISQLNYSVIDPAGASTFNGTPTVGEKVMLNDGTARSLDFTGYYITLGFRFYM